MEHKHGVFDSDTRFSINPITRQIRNDSNRKIVLIQNDHKSEVFTFECPRTVEGHDMSLCNEVEVHFLNISSDKKREKSGFVTLEDFRVDPEDNSKVVCSWEIDINSTRLAGSLNFLLFFKCKEDDVITYGWHTAIYEGIFIAKGINADESFESDYVDVIERWKAKVMAHFTAELAAWKENTAAEIREEAFEDIAVERKRIDLLSNYVTPEMFGAVGDGVTDDTLAILAACRNENGLPVLFAPKTYIINIVPNENAEQNYFFDNPTATVFVGVKGKTVIKLGDNDNCNLEKGNGFESIFHFTRSEKEIVFSGVTFDFNYKNNVIHHKSWQTGTVENNIQQVAIGCYYVKSLRVSDCTFVGHSGTNVINFRANKNLNIGYCVIENCAFLDLGNKSIHQGLEAYHDHSTLSIHCDNTGNHDFEFIVRVENNYFQGVGGNAFNACECFASNFVFSKNVIENYAMGVQPASDYENTKVTISDNTFKGIGCAVAVNCNHIDNTRTDGECAFDVITIHDNSIVIDAVRTFATPTYESFRNTVGGYYKGNWIGVVQGINSIRKSINAISVKNNHVLFEDVSGLPDGLFDSSNYYNGCFMNFSNISGVEGLFVNTILVENNRIENLPSKLLSLIPYSAIKEIIVRSNEVINPFRRPMAQAFINGGLVALTGTLQELNLIDFSNNHIDYDYTSDFYGAVILTTSIADLGENAILKMTDNMCRKPYYGLVHETGEASPFKHKVIRETYLT